MALETHQVQVVHDVAALPETMPWRRLALDFGYRSAIALPLFFSEDDHGVLAIYSEDAGVFTDEAIDVLSELASDVGFGVEMLRARARRSTYRARFEASLEAVVRALATAAELRDPYTAGHQRRVAELAAAISTDLALDPSVTTGMRIAASIHDIGKLAVPSEILSRPGRISGPEFSIIKGHARAGHDILAGIDFPWPVAEMILQHHERLDGSGYPAGLRGEEISIGARILAVADTVEAMQSHRPYRPGSASRPRWKRSWPAAPPCSIPMSSTPAPGFSARKVFTSPSDSARGVRGCLARAYRSMPSPVPRSNATPSC